MIRYILGRVGDTYYIADIYKIVNNVQLYNIVYKNESYPFRLESKYRYSGILYDRLRCLTSYVHYNYYDHIVDPYDPYHFFVCVIETRFDTRTMKLQYNKRLYYSYANSLLENLYFVKY